MTAPTIKTFPVRLSFHSFTEAGTEGGWTLAAVSEGSHINVFEITLTHTEMGRLLSSRDVVTPIELVVSPLHGKVMESDKVRIDLDRVDFDLDQAALMGLVRRLLHDGGVFASNGWVPDELDRFNAHKAGSGGYEVIVRRYVDAETDQIAGG